MVSKAQVIYTFTINNSAVTEQISFREAAKWYFKRTGKNQAVVRRNCDDEMAIFNKKDSTVSKQKKII